MWLENNWCTLGLVCDVVGMCCECDVVDGDVFAICEEITRQSDVSEKGKMSKHTDRTYQWSLGNFSYHIHENTGREPVITRKCVEVGLRSNWVWRHE